MFTIFSQQFKESIDKVFNKTKKKKSDLIEKLSSYTIKQLKDTANKNIKFFNNKHHKQKYYRLRYKDIYRIFYVLDEENNAIYYQYCTKRDSAYKNEISLFTTNLNLEKINNLEINDKEDSFESIQGSTVDIKLKNDLPINNIVEDEADYYESISAKADNTKSFIAKPGLGEKKNLWSLCIDLNEKQNKFVDLFKKENPVGPWILNGTAGSGKTIMLLKSIYELQSNKDNTLNICFTTYTNSLINSANEEFKEFDIKAECYTANNLASKIIKFYYNKHLNQDAPKTPSFLKKNDIFRILRDIKLQANILINKENFKGKFKYKNLITSEDNISVLKNLCLFVPFYDIDKKDNFSKPIIKTENKIEECYFWKNDSMEHPWKFLDIDLATKILMWNENNADAHYREKMGYSDKWPYEFIYEEIIFINERNLNKELYVNTTKRDLKLNFGSQYLNHEEKEVIWFIYEKIKNIAHFKKLNISSEIFIEASKCLEVLKKSNAKLLNEIKYDYIFIDEAHDLSYVSLKFLTELVPINKIILSYDISQTLYARDLTEKEILSLFKAKTQIPIIMKFKEVFRTTNKNWDFSLSFLKACKGILWNRGVLDTKSAKGLSIQNEYKELYFGIDKDTTINSKCFNDSIDEPLIFINYSTTLNFNKKVIHQLSSYHLINNLSIEFLNEIDNYIIDNKLNYSDIVFLVDTHNQGKILQSKLPNYYNAYFATKEYNPKKKGSLITTVHSSKGLEFKVVIFPYFMTELSEESLIDSIFRDDHPDIYDHEELKEHIKPPISDQEKIPFGWAYGFNKDIKRSRMIFTGINRSTKKVIINTNLEKKYLSKICDLSYVRTKNIEHINNNPFKDKHGPLLYKDYLDKLKADEQKNKNSQELNKTLHRLIDTNFEPDKSNILKIRDNE
ncbi:AAA family ATPase [bacterium]|nr:AAA family ATPase [bacterium]